ncbi:hypothetical protein ZEAMMB73_Zm00001d003143 [Zea mays]|uniref:Uncharacterized protein n=1 Tax=Zea mays TaxID=4577 RepID=A0A1D6E6Z8_MAIZE|nr:hypothetical protein ZEAMMB73_Zm00001d003143 [Zea mays]ONM16211.1 hypothetical protein ZEAMMB73_Zm00001d003143 [Zea mays]
MVLHSRRRFHMQDLSNNQRSVDGFSLRFAYMNISHFYPNLKTIQATLVSAAKQSNGAFKFSCSFQFLFGFCRDRDSGYLTPLIQNDSTESLLRWQCQPVSHRNYRTTREIQIRRFQGSARMSCCLVEWRCAIELVLCDTVDYLVSVLS